MTSRAGKPDTEADVTVRELLDADEPKSFAVVAGAGSGKTTSIVKALDYLARTKAKKLKQKGQKVACITYTEVAVREIWGDVGNNPLFHVSTIHSFLWTLIKPLQRDIQNWVAAHIALKVQELQEEQASFSARVRQKRRDRVAADIERYGQELTMIGNVKRFNYGTGSDYPNGILGHNDILVMVPALIEQHELLRRIIAAQFPFIFVDESQDTDPAFVNALKLIANTLDVKLCLGFFGDPMQQIYPTGIGPIVLGDGGVQIDKPENFRCPTKVLRLINKIRADGDDLQQTGGRTEKRNGVDVPVVGAARIFIVPNDEHKAQRLTQIRTLLAEQDNDPKWTSDEKDADVRMLVIAHRMAAARLKFSGLYEALADSESLTISEGFKDGTLWAVKPFLSYILPLVQAHTSQRDGIAMRLLRAHAPNLSEVFLAINDVPEVLQQLKVSLDELITMFAQESRATIFDVLSYCREHGLANIDERLDVFMAEFDPEQPLIADEEDSPIAISMDAYLRVPVIQMIGYRTYIEDQSPFSTQQGIKGAQFERVLTVCDDAEGNHRQFSYDKYFGLAPLSDKDNENIAQGKDNTLARTCRLFYVCCSRAVLSLAVVLFADNPAFALEQIEAKDLFEREDIHLLTETL